ETPHLALREVRPHVAPEGRVELAAAVVAAQAVVAVPVEIEKEGGAPARFAARVEGIAQLVVAVRRVAGGGEEPPAVGDEGFPFPDHLPVEIDEVRIGVRQQVLFVIGVEKDRRRAREGLHQAFPGPQGGTDALHQAELAARPLEKRPLARGRCYRASSGVRVFMLSAWISVCMRSPSTLYTRRCRSSFDSPAKRSVTMSTEKCPLPAAAWSAWSAESSRTSRCGGASSCSRRRLIWAARSMVTGGTTRAAASP